MELNIFEKASRQQLRFESASGLVTVEDLWNLPLTSATGRANLNDIARGVHQQLKAAGDEISFVEPAESNNEDLQLHFDVVKRIIDVRVEERNAAKAETDRKAKKQKIMEIIARKEDESLSNSSIEDLRQMLESV
jgi:hypothetical protein